jgi:ABC-2 type transport system permease protein
MAQMMGTRTGGEVYGIFRRWLTKLRRRPTALFFSLIQPLVWFLLFTQSFQAIANIPGFSTITHTDSYLVFFSAAVIIQTVITSALQSGIGMVDDLESGFLDKMRVAPIRRSSILLGKVFSDGFRILIQAIIIILIGLVVGVVPVTGIVGIILVLLLAAGFGIAWSGISTFIALWTKNSETTLLISLLTTFPLLFLSTAVMPRQLLAGWVQSFSDINPISYIVNAMRGLIVTGYNWSDIGIAFLTIIVVGVVTLGATTAMFRRTLSK